MGIRRSNALSQTAKAEYAQEEEEENNYAIKFDSLHRHINTNNSRYQFICIDVP